MIRISRGPEPPELASIRKDELERVRGIPNPTSGQVGKKYRKFAGDLRMAQHCKCCYCEVHVLESYNDVEHYRPKARADRKPGSVETYGYWWLTWTWSNLLFACPGCNRSGKNDAFPLDDGSVSLAAENDPPGEEKPLLIDPSEENGSSMIRFVVLSLPDGSARWTPESRDDDERGRITIEVLGLDRDDLLDLYSIHFQKLEPTIEDVRRAMSSGDPQTVKEEWRRAIRMLRPFCEFIGLTHDILEYSFPADVRDEWDLALPDLNLAPNDMQASTDEKL